MCRKILILVVVLCSATALSGEVSFSSAPASIDEEVASLRREGVAAVDRLASKYVSSGGSLSALRLVPANSLTEAQRSDVEALRLLDQVCGQRFCIYSKLFWHTDFAEAKAQALRENKPLLALVLLGDLRDELSCANSRFFRTLLYPDPHISQLLRNNFVLYWKKHREVPTIEVSFPNGRKIKNTITGNSIHYVLDMQGRIVDALPGLYAPERFFSEIAKAGDQARKLGALNDADFRSEALTYHQTRKRESGEEYLAAVNGLGLDPTAALRLRRIVDQLNESPAVAASRITKSKMVMEDPYFAGMAMLRTASLDKAVQKSVWEQLAERFPQFLTISDQSMRLIQNLRGDRITEKGFWSSISRNLAIDTVKNEFELRPTIRAWLMNSKEAPTLETINSLVYSMLFKMPAEDITYGLVTPETFSGLVEEGYHEP